MIDGNTIYIMPIVEYSKIGIAYWLKLVCAKILRAKDLAANQR